MMSCFDCGARSGEGAGAIGGISYEMVVEVEAESGLWSEIAWRTAPQLDARLDGKHGAKRGVVYEGMKTSGDVEYVEVRIPLGSALVDVAGFEDSRSDSTTLQ